MPAAVMTPQMWDECRIAYEQGVGYRELSKQYGPKEDTIRKRASLHGWINPVKQAQAVHAEKVKRTLARVRHDAISEGPKGLEVVANSLAELEERHALPLANHIQNKLERSIASDLLPDPSSWKDANTAARLLRTILGLDKPQVAISISPWGVANHEKQVEAIEAE